MWTGEPAAEPAGTAWSATADERRPVESTSLTLEGRTPFDWYALRTYLAARAIPGVETVGADGRYRRTVRIGEAEGWLAIGPVGGAGGPPGAAAAGEAALRPDAAPEPEGEDGSPSPDVAVLRLESAGLQPVLDPLIARVRRLLDLDADPRAIDADLARHRRLAPLVARRPGLRLPGTVDRFELAVRTVLGQQVTVRGASTLAGRLVRLVAEPLAVETAEAGGEAHRPASLTHLPITAERLAGARPEALAAIGLPRARAATLVALARAVADGELPALAEDAGGDPAPEPEDLVRRLTALPGIGPWTATYVAMRALPWPDAFPEGDLGLRKAAGGLTPARLRAAAEAWRPWRAYAAQHLWASL